MLVAKVHIVKAMVFPVVISGCQSWTTKKEECQRIDTFKLWCWRRLLTVLWIARRSNPSILKEINPEYSLEGLMLKLKLQYFGHLMGTADSLEKTLMLEKIEGRWKKGGNRGWDDWMTSPSPWTWVWANSEMVKNRKAWHAAVHGVTKIWTRLSNWRTAQTWLDLKGVKCCPCSSLWILMKHRPHPKSSLHTFFSIP